MNEVKPDNKKQGPKEGKSSEKLIEVICHDTFEFIGITITLISVLIITAAIILHKRDIPLDFLKPVIEESLNSPERNISVNFDSLLLKWPEIRKPLVLDVSGIQIQEGQNSPFFSIKNAQVQFYLTDLFLGKLSLESIQLNKPFLRLIHLGDQQFVVSFAQESYELPSDASNENKESVFHSFLRRIVHAPQELPESYRKLRNISMQQASVQITDFGSGRTLRLEPADLKLQKEDNIISGEFVAELPEDYGVDSRVVLLAEQEAHSDTSKIQISLKQTNIKQIIQEWGEIPEQYQDFLDVEFMMDALIEVEIEDFQDIQEANLELFSNAVTYGDFEDEELAIKASYVNKGTEQNFYLDEFAFADFKLRSGLAYKPALTAEGNHSLKLQLEIDAFDADLLDKYWPEPGEGEKQPLQRLWLVEKLSKGRFSDMNAEIVFLADASQPETNFWKHDWKLDWDRVLGVFSFAALDIQYFSKLAPAEKAVGEGELRGKRLTLNVSEAIINNLDVKEGGQLVFSDLVTKGSGNADIKLSLSGKLPDLFDFLSDEPISIKDRVQIPLEAATGDVSVDVEIAFPTVRELKNEDVKVSTKGVFSDLSVPEIVKGLTLSGPRFEIETSREEFTFSGEGKLGGTVAGLKWHSYLKTANPYKNKIDVKTRASDELRTAFNIDFRDMIPSAVPLDITYKTLTKDKADLVVNADTTESDFEVSAFNYKKPKGNKGSLKFKARLDKEKITDIDVLTLQGPSLDVRAKNLKFIPEDAIFPRMGEIEKFQIGFTDADVTVKNETLSKDKPLFLNVEARSVDASKFISKSKGGFAGQLPPLHIQMKTDKLLLKNRETIDSAELLFKQDTEGTLQNVSLSGTSGGAPIQVRFHPDKSNEPHRLIFEAGNAGAAMRALGLFKTIDGGTVSLRADPVPGGLPQEVQGRLYISNFKITDTPFIAQLLNALSVEGFLQLLEDKDLSFTEFKANISTKKTEAGDWQVNFANAKTRGTSLGIIFDGHTNVDQKTLDVKGQIIPASGLNKAIGNIPVIGQILSGGDEAVFAANFSMKGSDKEPKVTVNPLSALTPGFLRKFLFDD